MAKRVVVHGKVQGVFFRDSVSREAESRGLSGWVRNTDDGTVEALFSGASEAVDALVDYCRSGPPDASVDAVDVEDAEPYEGTGFSVR